MENCEKGSEASQNPFQRLRAENPGKEIAFEAIKQLKDETQIREFFQQYVESFREIHERDAEKVARGNIFFALSDYGDKETTDRWKNMMDASSIDAKRAYEAGTEKGDKEKE